MDEILEVLLRRPLVAILRGVRPDEVEAVADVLVDCGFRAIEVPLNSPDPLASIEVLVRRFGEKVVVGAGTVLNAPAVARCAASGARLVLAPNRNLDVIRTARSLGLVAMPGVATPSEAFDALDAGAQALKLFPADVLGTASLRAWKAVLPPDPPVFVVGGVSAGNLRSFRDAGAAGAGLGSSLYTPGLPLEELRRRAVKLLGAW